MRGLRRPNPDPLSKEEEVIQKGKVTVPTTVREVNPY